MSEPRLRGRRRENIPTDTNVIPGGTSRVYYGGRVLGGELGKTFQEKRDERHIPS